MTVGEVNGGSGFRCGAVHPAGRQCTRDTNHGPDGHIDVDGRTWNDNYDSNTRWGWGGKDTSVCRVAGKRKDGLYTLRVDQDMLQRIADEFGIDGAEDYLQ